MVFYQLGNLDSRISNPDQRLTADLEKWSNSLSTIYSNFTCKGSKYPEWTKSAQPAQRSDIFSERGSVRQSTARQKIRRLCSATLSTGLPERNSLRNFRKFQSLILKTGNLKSILLYVTNDLISHNRSVAIHETIL